MAKDQIKEILRARHHIPEGVKNDFQVLLQEELLETTGAILGTITSVVGGIVSIALLVGGIGIMNIMLVSVTERTREIGVRKAVGARKSDILVQFLIEAVTMSLVGGLIGRPRRLGSGHHRRQGHSGIPAGARAAVVDRAGVRFRRPGRGLLRHLPGRQGRVTRSDRRA